MINDAILLEVELKGPALALLDPITTLCCVRGVTATAQLCTSQLGPSSLFSIEQSDPPCMISISSGSRTLVEYPLELPPYFLAPAVKEVVHVPWLVPMLEVSTWVRCIPPGRSGRRIRGWNLMSTLHFQACVDRLLAVPKDVLEGCYLLISGVVKSGRLIMACAAIICVCALALQGVVRFRQWGSSGAARKGGEGVAFFECATHDRRSKGKRLARCKVTSVRSLRMRVMALVERDGVAGALLAQA